MNQAVLELGVWVKKIPSSPQEAHRLVEETGCEHLQCIREEMNVNTVFKEDREERIF